MWLQHIREFTIAVYRANVKQLRHNTACDPSTFHVVVAVFAHVCTCRPVSRHLNLPQRFSHDSRLIYMFGKLILIKLVKSYCDLPFAVCTINGNLELSIVVVCAALIPTIGKKYQHLQAILLSCPKDTQEKVIEIIPPVTAHT